MKKGLNHFSYIYFFKQRINKIKIEKKIKNKLDPEPVIPILFNSKNIPNLDFEFITQLTNTVNKYSN